MEASSLQRSATTRESRKRTFPARLLLIAVRELDMGVFEGEVVFVGEFLEADDEVVSRGVGPGTLGNEGCAHGFELRVLEYADGTAFDVDGVARVD